MQTILNTSIGIIRIYSFRIGDKLLDAESKIPNYNNHVIFISLNKKRFSFETWLPVSDKINNANDNVSVFISYLSNMVNNNLDYQHAYNKAIVVLGTNLKKLLSELSYKYLSELTQVQLIFKFITEDVEDD